MVTAATHGRSGRPWRRIREQVLRRDPYCTVRGPRCTGISTTADHRIPLSVRPELAHDLDNLRGACGPCNYAGGARITNRRRTRLRPRPAPGPAGGCTWTLGSVCLPGCHGFPLPAGCRAQSPHRY